MRIGELRQVLRDSGVLGEVGGEPTPAELARGLWLAAARRAGHPAPPADLEAPSATDVPGEIEDRGAAEKPAEPTQAGLSPPSSIPQPDLPEPASPLSPVLANLPVPGAPSSGVVAS